MDETSGKALQTGKVKSQTGSEGKLQQVSKHKLAMERLWERMTEIFGHAWASQYGDSDGRAFITWSEGLAQYSLEQIRRGLINAVDPKYWDSAFPPNLVQFQHLCLTVDRSHPSHKPFAIEHQPKRSSVKTAREQLANLRNVLAGNTTIDINQDLERYEKILNGGGQ